MHMFGIFHHSPFHNHTLDLPKPAIAWNIRYTAAFDALIFRHLLITLNWFPFIKTLIHLDSK